MNSKSLFVVGRAKKRSIYMNDLRGKFQKSRKILMPSMHAAAVWGIFLSFFAGSELFSATTWIGTDENATD